MKGLLVLGAGAALSAAAASSSAAAAGASVSSGLKTVTSSSSCAHVRHDEMQAACKKRCQVAALREFRVESPSGR